MSILMVSDAMTPRVSSVEPDDDLRVATERMIKEGVHRLMVILAGRLVGVLSVGDCARELACVP